MQDYPKIPRVRFQQCCKKSLRLIDLRIKIKRQMKSVLEDNPILMAIEQPGLSNAKISSRDWKTWEKAIRKLDHSAKRRCQRFCEKEMDKHMGGNMKIFWKTLHNSFK